MLTMTNFSHNRDADPNYRLETDRKNAGRLSLRVRQRGLDNLRKNSVIQRGKVEDV